MSSGGKYRVHPPFAPVGSTFPPANSVPRHVWAECDQVCGCGQVTCPCSYGPEVDCADRNYMCCDGRMTPLPDNCRGTAYERTAFAQEDKPNE